jgi:hypothetical protein
MSTKELYTIRIIQKTNTAHLELHTHTSQHKKFKVLFQMSQVIVVVAPLLDATNFENDYPATKELACTAICEESVTCACIPHIISHGTT